MTSRNPKKLDSEGLWNYALRALAGRSYSVAELKQKLARRAASSADIAGTIAKLREYGMADDKKFSEVFASSRLQNQGFGRFRVLQDLRGKRVAPALAENAVAAVFAGADEQELAGKFLQRKYRGKNLSEFLAEEKNLAAAYRRLRTAGFSANASLAVLRSFAKGIELEAPPEESE